MGRFTFQFLDTLLVLVWYGMGAAAFVVALGMGFPQAAAWIKTRGIGPDTVATVLALSFVVLSITRLMHNRGLPVYSFPACYGVTVVFIHMAAHNTWIQEPNWSYWVAGVFPAFMVGLLYVILWYVWSKIKPRRKRRRIPE